MNTPNIAETSPESTATAPVEEPKASAEKPKAAKKAKGGAQKDRGGSQKGKPGKKASAGKKPAKAPKPAEKAKSEGPREGSKTEKVLSLLKRPDGATLKEIMKATGWQPHSVRGFLSGTVGKNLGLTVISAKTEDGERSYSVKG